MQKLWKKSISIIIALLLVAVLLLFTGCNNANGNNSTEETVPPSINKPIQPSKPDTTPSDPSKPVEPVQPPSPIIPPEEPDITPPQPVDPTPKPDPEPVPPTPEPVPPVIPDPAPPTPEPVPPTPVPTVKPAGPQKQKNEYTYRPKLTQQVPAVRITTADGSNAFATEEREYYPTGSDGNQYFAKQEFAYQNCTVSIDNCESEFLLSNVVGQIKVRGNTTPMYPKKPFRLKFTQKQSLLGLNNNISAKNWVLLADWKDASLLRNSVGLYLGNLFFGSEGLYASDFRSVELYLNGEYWGMYLLCEYNQVNHNRVNIAEPEKGYMNTNIGYYLELDDYNAFEKELEKFTLSYNGDAKLIGADGKELIYKNPNYTIKSDVYSAAQRDFISNYLENIYKICYKAIYDNQYYVFNTEKTDIVQSSTLQNAKDTIANVVDIDSIVASYLIEEITKNWDIGSSSFFMTVDLGPNGDGRLRFQTAWDFDSALGNTISLESTDGIYAGNGGGESGNSGNPWLVLFYKAEWFKEMVKAKWNDAKAHGIKENILQFIKDSATYHFDAYAKNFAKWQNIGENIKTYYEMTKTLTDLKGTNINNSFSDLLYDVTANAALDCNSQGEAAGYLYHWLELRFDSLNALFQ